MHFVMAAKPIPEALFHLLSQCDNLISSLRPVLKMRNLRCKVAILLEVMQ